MVMDLNELFYREQIALIRASEAGTAEGRQKFHDAANSYGMKARCLQLRLRTDGDVQ